MRYLRTSIIIFTIMMFAITLASCSASSKNQSPLEPSNQSNDLPLSFGTKDTSGRSILAVYDLVIDPVAKTFAITPSERTADYHFPLTRLYPNVLKIVGYGWTPNFWADIKLAHPFPGSGIDGFDPRIIAILPANAGVRFIYPTLGVGGNNKVVLEPDGYTPLFDNLGAGIPGNVNPFKAYFKDQPNRVWSSTGVISETQRWQINLSGFGGPMVFKLVVDVSTNYPNPSTPIVNNASEPVNISAVIGSGLTSDGGSADITITVLDWQGKSRIGGVIIESPQLFVSLTACSYYGPGPLPYEYVFTGEITNTLHAPEGKYAILVASWDTTTEISAYNEFNVAVTPPINTGNLIWAKSAEGDYYDEAGCSIATLSDDSIVVTGWFGITTKFGKDEPNEIILNSYGLQDIFIARYNPDGTLMWVKHAGGESPDGAYAITALSDNSTVITGSFYSTNAIFGEGETNQTELISYQTGDIFIAKYNPDGTLAWAKGVFGAGYDEGRGIATLSGDKIVVTGYFEGEIIFEQSEPDQKILIPVTYGYYDVFIVQYSADGTCEWAKQAGGTMDDYGSGIAKLPDNSIAITGGFRGSATFGQGDPNQTVLIPTGRHDTFIARYNSNGAIIWAKRAGGTGYTYSQKIAPLTDNSSAIVGFFDESSTFGPGETGETTLSSSGETDIFIARYNPDGTLAWAKREGGGDSNYGWDITSLSDNSTVITGNFSGVYIARYNPDGSLEWDKKTGGTYYADGYGITYLSNNSTVVTGRFNDSIIFGLGEPGETTLTAVVDPDIFIAQFEP